jgi:hypothetical protein
MVSCHLTSHLLASSGVSQQLLPFAFQSLPLVSSSLPVTEKNNKKGRHNQFQGEGRILREKEYESESNRPSTGHHPTLKGSQKLLSLSTGV